jgi:hypothetical protein
VIIPRALRITLDQRIKVARFPVNVSYIIDVIPIVIHGE